MAGQLTVFIILIASTGPIRGSGVTVQRLWGRRSSTVGLVVTQTPGETTSKPRRRGPFVWVGLWRWVVFMRGP